MPTKQVQMEFQVAANDNTSAQVNITVGGTQVFSGALAQTTNPLPGQVFDDLQPCSMVEFELDVLTQPDPPGNAQPWGQWTTPVDVVISVTGGNIALQDTEVNYSMTVQEVLPATVPPTWQQVPGTANAFVQCHFANQPVWTPPAVGRLTYQDNVDTGPGSLLLLDGESCAYQVAMPYFSN
jgi:hypothetical protein